MSVPARPRFGQLTYTSYDASGAAGGWQVKQTTGAMTEQESTFLADRVSTRVVAEAALPYLRRPTASMLRIETDPPGALVYVDGRARGASPLAVGGEAGRSYAVRAVRPGWRDDEQLVTAAAGDSPVRLHLDRLAATLAVETDPAGARVLVDSVGLRHGPAEVLARLARGDDVDPALYYFRTAMRFETGDPSTDWLNRILAVAHGRRRAQSVRLDVYEVE